MSITILSSFRFGRSHVRGLGAKSSPSCITFRRAPFRKIYKLTSYDDIRYIQVFQQKALAQMCTGPGLAQGPQVPVHGPTLLAG